MDKIVGDIRISGYFDAILIRKLMEYGLEAIEGQSNFDGNKYIQHGDVKRENVLWNGNSFRLIDLDNIGYYPPFFDILHYLGVAKYNLSEVLWFLKENEDILKKYYKKLNIEENRFLDEILFGFVNCYKDTNFYDDFSFLTLENTVNYPKTHKMLKNMADNV